MRACTNCGAEMADVFCAQCGERQPGHHDLSVKHFGQELVHEIAHVDSKLFTTLRDLLTRPGFLPQEHFAGRKSRTIPPLRLFLTLFAIQFLAFTIYKPAARYSITSMKRFDTNGSLSRLLDRQAKKNHLTSEEYESKVDERWHKNLSLLQLVNIIGVAIVLKMIYSRRYLAEHLVFSAYLLSFSYILSLALWPVWAIFGFHPGPLQKILTVLTIGTVLVYLYFAQRRFYGASKGITLLKTALIWGGIFLVTMIVMASSLISAIWQNRA